MVGKVSGVSYVFVIEAFIIYNTLHQLRRFCRHSFVPRRCFVDT